MIHVGLDIGYGQTKLAWSSGYNGPMAQIHPSGAAPIELIDRVAAGGVEGDLGAGEEVLVHGRRYGALVDPDSIKNGMQVLHQDYSATPEYLALALGALARLKTDVVDHLVTGLPVSQCKDREKAARVKDLLQRHHEIRPGFGVSVKKVTIVPQGVGAYYAFLDRRPAGADKHDTLLICDFGHYSVDWVLISAGKFRDASSNSSALGGSYVIDKMVALIQIRHSISISRERMYGYVREGMASVQLGRERVDLAEIRQLAAAEVVPSVIGQIRSSLRDQSTDVNRVLVCGGSAPFYEAYVAEAFPKALVESVTNPVLANANGFRLFARKAA